MAIERLTRSDRWEDAQDERDSEAAGHKPLTREAAGLFRLRHPSLSPWRVVGVQVWVGLVTALFAALITGRQALGWSALYGAAAVVVPGVLIARGMTSRLSSLSSSFGAVSFMLWESVKIAVSVAMLVLAPKIVQSLNWPALLVGLVLCIQVYWLALLWRPAAKKPN